MTIKLYLDFMSQPSRALMIFLRRSGIKHELVPLLIKKMEHKAESYVKKVNPFGIVPSIVDEDKGVPVIESVAIARYLAQTQDISDHWYPKDPVKQSRVDAYMEWQHLNTRLNCAMYFQTKWVIPAVTQEPPNEKRVKRFQKGMEASLDAIESIWLKNGANKYIAGGEQISVADLFACCELEQPSVAGYSVREGRTVLTDYMQRVREETNPDYDEAHKVHAMMVKKFGGKIPGLEVPLK